VGAGQKAGSLSHQEPADGTGLSKSAVLGAVRPLKRRKLLCRAEESGRYPGLSSRTLSAPAQVALKSRSVPDGSHEGYPET
jgi:hypothetical protein